MWRSYFQVFFRNLLKQKTIAAINVLGLALGLCAFLVIGVYVQDEYSRESRWQNADRIARLVNHLVLRDGTNFANTNVSKRVGPDLKNFLPGEVELTARVIYMPGDTIRVDGEEFRDVVLQADPELIGIFDFDVIEGSLDQAFAGPNRIAVSEEFASRILGGGPALGKVLTLEVPETGDVSFDVVAVYRLPSGKGALEFPNFTLLTAATDVQPEESALFGTANSYFLLREGVEPTALDRSLDAFVDQNIESPLPVPEGGTTADVFTYRLQNIRDVHFNPMQGEPGGSQSQVNAFGAIALLVLAIGWSNFVILALARSTERQREVGIRKTAGATGPFLLSQFIAEALLLAMIALVLALVLLESALPVFATLMQTTLSLDWAAGSTLLVLAILLLVTGSIGGIYPALVLARQKPELVLKPGGQSSPLSTWLLRKVLVSFQFLIATALIIATLVLYLQMAFVRQRDPGFDTANVVTLDLGRGGIENPSEVAVLRNAVAAIPGVEQTALASHEAATLSNVFKTSLWRPGDAAGRVDANLFLVDYDFFSIYRMTLLAGRGFDRALDGSTENELAAQPNPRNSSLSDRLVVNATAARALGFANPADAVGKIVDGRERRPDGSVIIEPVEIIGVVADNQFGSLRLAPGSEFYQLNSWASWYLTIKVAPVAMPTIAAELQRVWQELRPLSPAEISFADSKVQQAFALELNTGRLVSGFGLLAIVVACMGLYGLVAFEARRRTKEICIRNVFGAELLSILKLFLARFAGPVLWTNALAWPLALWFMLRWLEQFPYRIENWWLLPVCIAAGTLVIGIVALTVGTTVVKVVKIRPAQNLRYE